GARQLLAMRAPHLYSALQMQDADQREDAARRVVIDVDLALEPLAQQRRAFVVQPAAAHVERLDLRRRRVADRLVVALADQKVVPDDAAERRERQHDLAVRLAAREADVED